MRDFKPRIQVYAVVRFAGLCHCLLCTFLVGDNIYAQKEASVKEELRRLIPSATDVGREAFEKMTRSSKSPKRNLFETSLTTELMFLDHQTIQGSDGEFRYLWGNRPKPAQLVGEMYRSVGEGRLRIVTHPVTMIQAERITKLEVDVDGRLPACLSGFPFATRTLFDAGWKPTLPRVFHLKPVF